MKIHLNQITAIAAAFLAGKQTSDAQIIYHDVDPDFHFADLNNIPGGDELFVDLNEDGLSDLHFIADGRNFDVFALNDVEIAGDCCLLSPDQIGESHMIGPYENWNDNSNTLFHLWTSAGEANFTTGAWGNQVNRFIGVRIPVDDNFYYGWVRLNSVFSTEGPLFIRHLDVIDYALNSIPDESILAGEGLPVKCFVPNVLSSQTGLFVSYMQWEIIPGAEQYEIFYRKTGFATWTKIKTEHNHKPVAGLLCNVSYEWKVRGRCYDGSTTAFSPVQLFTTDVCRMENNNLLTDDMVVFPNPAHDQFTIDLEGFEDEFVKIEVYDMAGVLILSESADHEMIKTISTENIHTGSYIVKVISQNATVVKKIIILQE